MIIIVIIIIVIIIIIIIIINVIVIIIQEEDPPGEMAAEPIWSEVYPQKDATYLPSTLECSLHDSNISGS